jgi:hypothetical protein
MEKIGAKSLFRFWAILGLLAMIVIWFLPWRFQTNDDELMMWLVSGAYTGTPESYAVFIHPILSWCFSKLYTLFPEIRWYPLTWFSVLYLGYFGLLKVIFQRKSHFASNLVLAAVVLCLLIHFALFMQFTIVSGFAALAGFSLIVSFTPEQKFGRSLLILLLLLLSLLIRWESLALVGLGFFGYLIFLDSRLLRARIFFLFSILLLFLTGFFSKTIWENSSSYSSFVSYNQARAAVSDHPVTFRYLTEEKIKADSKWFYFSQWMMDEDQISIAELEERRKKLNTELLTLPQIKSSFLRLYQVARTEAFKSVFSIIIIIYFFLSGYDVKKKVFFFSCWAAFFLVFNHFFITNGRVVILFIFPFLMASIVSPFEIRAKIAVPILILLFFLMSIHTWNFMEEARGRKIMRDEFLGLQKDIPINSLVILEGYKENYLGIHFSQKKPVPFISFGWISKSPFQKKVLFRLGLRSILDTKDFYLFGVDVQEEFFFEGYMNFRAAKKYVLKEKISSNNWFRFHFEKAIP